MRQRRIEVQTRKGFLRVDIPAPYDTLKDVQYMHAGDKVILCHKDYPPVWIDLKTNEWHGIRGMKCSFHKCDAFRGVNGKLISFGEAKEGFLSAGQHDKEHW